MKIYIASKANHRDHWRWLRDNHQVPIISRWIDVDDKYSADPTGLDFKSLWEMCVEDVNAADVLVVYLEPGEVLKGALVEVGGALMAGKRVVCVGNLFSMTSQGTWYHHPLVEDWCSLGIDEALLKLCGEAS